MTSNVLHSVTVFLFLTISLFSILLLSTSGLGSTNNGELFGRFFIAFVRINVAIDIKPGSNPNSLNLCSEGAMPVAILSSAELDATTVDPDTVRLADAQVRTVGKSGKLLCHTEDVDGDGLADLVCQIVMIDLAASVGTADTSATLRAMTFDGTTIKGTDSIRIVKDFDCNRSTLFNGLFLF